MLVLDTDERKLGTTCMRTRSDALSQRQLPPFFGHPLPHISQLLAQMPVKGDKLMKRSLKIMSIPTHCLTAL